MIVPLFDKIVKVQLMKIDEFQSQYLSIDYFQSFTILFKPLTTLSSKP